MKRTGQATVELALGSLVIVSVLMIGIYMAEFGQLSLKVSDASTFATWDRSLRRVQTRGTNGATSLAPFTPAVSASQAQARFSDFDGVGGDGSSTVTRALARGSNLIVRCYPGGASGSAPGERGLSFHATETGRRVFRNEGGFSCWSSARLRANTSRMNPNTAMRSDGAFFEQQLVSSQAATICGMGFANGTTCTGRLSLLSNDWSFATKPEQDPVPHCQDSGCAGSIYASTVGSMFGGGGAARALADRFAGGAQASGATFNFSYVGVEEGMTRDQNTEFGPYSFVTGGGKAGDPGRTFTVHSGDCFLGRAAHTCN